MPNVFISYSRETKETALRIRRDLQLNGFTEIFLDLDPIDGLKPGSLWENELKKQMFSSKAALLLVSRPWLASSNCRNEYMWALQAKERSTTRSASPVILPIFLSDVGFGDIGDVALYQNAKDNEKEPLTRLTKFTAYDMKVSLELDPDAPGERGLSDPLVSAQLEARRQLWDWLEQALRQANVDPVKLPFRAGQLPYPGLKAFQESDASVFFGREAEVDDYVQKLLDMRLRRKRNMLVIQGASGAGKSSVLRAGLLSRLKLAHAEDFYCLPTLRPGRAAITGPGAFIECLVNAFDPKKNYPPELYNDPKTNRIVQFERLEARGGITKETAKTALDEGVSSIEMLLTLLQDATSPAGGGAGAANPLTLILPIDQAEELLPLRQPTSSEDRRQHDEANRLRRLLADLLRPERRRINLVAVMAIRSDSFPRLQSDEILGSTVDKETVDLSPLPIASYRSVIEGPARLARIELQAALVSALLSDLEGVGDALPLLAFVLRRLYNVLDQKPSQWKTVLTLADYTGSQRWSVGGIKGALQKVVDNALGKDVDEELLRNLFVGHLATIDPQSGQFLRRIANANELPPGGREIAEALKGADARLLTSPDRSPDEYEVIHEAVLREWPKLKGWLEAAKGAMHPVQQARNDAQSWFDRRNELAAEFGADSIEVIEHDRDKRPLQGDLDRIWAALAALGRDRNTEPEPLRSFLQPEFDSLMHELEALPSTQPHDEQSSETAKAIHDRRNEIGVRLAQLGELRRNNKRFVLGDPRRGVSVVTPSRLALWRATQPDAAGRDRLEALQGILEAEQLEWDPEHPVSEDLAGIPDIVWCKVPPGEVVVHRDEQALRKWADTARPGELPNAQPGPSMAIGDDLWIAKYPITLAQFICFTGTGKDRPQQYTDEAWWNGFPEPYDNPYKNEVRDQSTSRNYPAQYTSWYQAVAYCRWLTARFRKLGLIPEAAIIRLPFEAEWIQAATGGKPRRYPWGDDWNPGLASNQEGSYRFVAAGLYPAGQSPTGALDMAGNLYEWCLNAYDAIDDAATTRDATRPTKGGSYYTQARAGSPGHALSVYHRFEDNANGHLDTGNRIAAGIRPVCVGLDPSRPAVASENHT